MSYEQILENSSVAFPLNSKISFDKLPSRLYGITRWSFLKVVQENSALIIVHGCIDSTSKTPCLSQTQLPWSWRDSICLALTLTGEARDSVFPKLINLCSVKFALTNYTEYSKKYQFGFIVFEPLYTMKLKLATVHKLLESRSMLISSLKYYFSLSIKQIKLFFNSSKTYSHSK